VIPLLPFPQKLHVIRNLNPNEAYTYIKEAYSDLDETINVDQFENNLGYTLRVPNGTIFMYIASKNDTIGLIVHESFHVVEFVMEFVDTPHCHETSEVFAYMLQYIV